MLVAALRERHLAAVVHERAIEGPPGEQEETLTQARASTHARTANRLGSQGVSDLERYFGTELGSIHRTLPVVPVEVVEAPAVHEAVILRLARGLAAVSPAVFTSWSTSARLAHDSAEQRLGVRARVADLALRERLEERLRQEHHVRLAR